MTDCWQARRATGGIARASIDRVRLRPWVGDSAIVARGAVANATATTVIGAVFFAAESALGARPALFIASALFVLAILTSASFLSWMRRA